MNLKHIFTHSSLTLTCCFCQLFHSLTPTYIPLQVQELRAHSRNTSNRHGFQNRSARDCLGVEGQMESLILLPRTLSVGTDFPHERHRRARFNGIEPQLCCFNNCSASLLPSNELWWVVERGWHVFPIHLKLKLIRSMINRRSLISWDIFSLVNRSLPSHPITSQSFNQQ